MILAYCWLNFNPPISTGYPLGPSRICLFFPCFSRFLTPKKQETSTKEAIKNKTHNHSRNLSTINTSAVPGIVGPRPLWSCRPEAVLVSEVRSQNCNCFVVGGFQLLLFEITSSGWYFVRMSMYVYPAIYDWLSTSLLIHQISEASTTSSPSCFILQRSPPLAIGRCRTATNEFWIIQG